MSNLAIYTVIAGDYDTIKQPRVITPGAEYYLFTNNHWIEEAGIWKIVYLDEPKLTVEWSSSVNRNDAVVFDNERINNILLSRKVKMLAHKYLLEVYDMSIYIDADMMIKANLSKLFELLNDDVLMAAFRHGSCFSVREEINDLIERGVVEQAVVENQWQRYLEWEFKDDIGVTENGILIRRHNNPKVVELMELWWQEYLHGCLRDQVSLMPCIFKCGFMSYMKFIEGNVRCNEWAEVKRHVVKELTQPCQSQIYFSERPYT